MKLVLPNITLDNGRKLVVTYSLKNEQEKINEIEKSNKKLKDKLEKISLLNHNSNQGYKNIYN